jgi:hypothetical protein
MYMARSVAATGRVITGLRTRVRRPEGECRACKEEENDKACFPVAEPVSVLHTVTPLTCDFLPGHRLPPIDEITLFPFSNKPILEGTTRDEYLSFARSSDFFSAGMDFVNVTLIFLLPFRSFLWKHRVTIDKQALSRLLSSRR